MLNAPTAFRITVDDAVLEDLDRRLSLTRWPGALEGAGWDYGTDTGYLRDLVDYWRTGYRWREREARMNELAHFRAEVDGMHIHYVHMRAGGRARMPIVLLHGWPGTFLEMTRLGRLLADAEGDGLDVIIPSLPGFGFSDAPTRPGFGYMRAAEVLHRLLTENLAYPRYATHGADVGCFVMSWMALAHPEAVIGLHMLEPGIPAPSLAPPAPPPSRAELDCIEAAQRWELHEGAYAHLQRTKPQTLAVGLNDSPAMLAAWLVEKYRTWSDCGGRLETRYTRDELLDIIMLYWVTQTGPSSVRAYRERQYSDRPMTPLERLRVPSGFALTPDLPGHPPRRWPREYVERGHDIRHWVEIPAGGHFASWEEPTLIAASIREFLNGIQAGTTDSDPSHGR
ncbi:MAG: epoxide hydrolase family protein [Gammaproteobacteria bacterium]